LYVSHQTDLNFSKDSKMTCEASIYSSIHDGYDFIIPSDEDSLRQVIESADWDEVSLHQFKVSEISASYLRNNLYTVNNNCVLVFEEIEKADDELVEAIETLIKNRALEGVDEGILTNIVLIAGAESAAYNKLKNVSNVRNYVDF
jgi:hypothetical protein